MNNELNKECDKKSWKAPKLTIMPVNDTEGKKGFGPDGGANSSWSHS